jgi:predicted nucleotidyltransferase
MTNEQYLPIITARIVERFHPLKVILFGSMARGDARPDSDLDLLVVLPHVENKHSAMVEIFRALSDIPAPVDVLVTTPEEIERRRDALGSVLRPALREGRVVYELA